MVVWTFNPGYEPSVKLGTASYTPSMNVQRFRSDCATLPLYLADPGDQVLLPEPLPPELDHPSFCTAVGDRTLSPWGWAPELSRYGELPYTLEEMRHLASRERSVELWQVVRTAGGTLFESGAVAPRILTRHADLPLPPFVLKELYSSSGRGISFITTAQTRLPSGSAPRVLEPMLDIVEDLGIEFERPADGTVRFLGLSRMQNTSGRYAGNRLNARSTPHPLIDEYVALLLDVLGDFDLGNYRGPLGVDTAIYRGNDGKRYLWPVVEINIRPTMGHLALALEQRYPQAQWFEIRYLADRKNLPNPVSPLPLYLNGDTDLRPGYHLLTPLLPTTHFVALLRV